MSTYRANSSLAGVWTTSWPRLIKSGVSDDRMSILRLSMGWGSAMCPQSEPKTIQYRRPHGNL